MPCLSPDLMDGLTQTLASSNFSFIEIVSISKNVSSAVCIQGVQHNGLWPHEKFLSNTVTYNNNTRTLIPERLGIYKKHTANHYWQ